jgi:CubicO group peptidase (beta-lactamase class C family)
MGDLGSTSVADAGLDPAAVDVLLDRVRREVDEGLLPACQIALARVGRVVVDETFGEADAADRFVVFSCTKAITAAAVWMLLSDGRLRLSQPVVDLIPEFSTLGKEVVTVEQLLTHTAGFPNARLGPPDWAHSAARRARFAEWRLEWEPGSRFEYHSTSANWVLAELIREVTGLDHRAFIRRELLDPMGLDALSLGQDPTDPAAAPPSALAVHIVGAPPSAAELEPLGEMGAELAALVEHVTYDERVIYGEPATTAIGAPAGGAVGTAAAMAMFYQALLRDDRGLFDPDVLERATARVACDLPDRQRGCSARRGLGVVIAGDDGFAPMRGFGEATSAQAFGHDGAGGQMAFGDPSTGLSVSYLTNGQDLNLLREWSRYNDVATFAARCVVR